MQTLLSLLTWLAIRAGARLGPRPGGRGFFAGAVPGVVLAETIGANRAGRLVPVPNDAPEPEPSLGAHWALWAAAALILLVVAAGYLRRRWKAAGRPARIPWPVWSRDQERK